MTGMPRFLGMTQAGLRAYRLINQQRMIIAGAGLAAHHGSLALSPS